MSGQFSIENMAKIIRQNDYIAPVLYPEYGVNLGLRDARGRGVLTGLTSVSKVIGSEQIDGKTVPCEGKLWYRGYRIRNLIRQIGEDSMGAEEVIYLLLTGEMPDQAEQRLFQSCLAEYRMLPPDFTRDVIMEAPGEDVMNNMMRSILTLASYDDRALDNGLENVLRQCLHLIAQMPLLAVYSYHAYNHKVRHGSMYIHQPDPSLSMAENILHMLRPNQQFTHLEAKVLDAALILHMEHGGGNNSTFTTRVVTSSGSDTYSTTAASMSSLKGPKHGGASIKVMDMMEDIRLHVKDCADEDEVEAYLKKILSREAFDRKGLIYGIGHAVYTLSDPRERIFRKYVSYLAEEKGRMEDFHLYDTVRRKAQELLMNSGFITKPVCPNVDFYSGFVYDMLEIPRELYTAMFATARIVGWSAHRMEELICTEKIIRPAYRSIMKEKSDE